MSLRLDFIIGFAVFHIHLILLLITFQHDAAMYNLRDKKKALFCL